MRKASLRFLGTWLCLGFSSVSWASNDCVIDQVGNTWHLRASCTTDASIPVPVANFNGHGFSITAVDPTGGHFRGGILTNGGPVLNVRNVELTVSMLTNVCDGGADRLRGVLLVGASGSVRNSTFTDINQGASGCQEGNAIEARNFGDAPETVHVVIDHNTITGYQKTGIVANGDVDAQITNNLVEGFGPVAYIAQNGIQIGFGATAKVVHNKVSGNSYTGEDWVSTGILLLAGPYYGSAYSVGDQIIGNHLVGNDVGIYVEQPDPGYVAPATPTKVRIEGNRIHHAAVTNGDIYQAGIYELGREDTIVGNRISGAGYDPDTIPGSTFAIDAQGVMTKIKGNKTP